MDPILQVVLAIVGSVLTSSWIGAILLKRMERKYAKSDADDALKQMVLGLGYAEIRRTGQEYICREWITSDELRAFETYIYKPYKALNGDGAGDQIWENVKSLDIREINSRNKREVCNV